MPPDTSGASASAEDAGAPSHAEQAPPLPPQENGQHPYAQHPYAQHQYAQPQYAQHAMYPMMYGAQPAAGPADGSTAVSVGQFAPLSAQSSAAGGQ